MTELNWGFVFMVWLTDEGRLALFLAGPIVRNPYHRKPPTAKSRI